MTQRVPNPIFSYRNGKRLDPAIAHIGKRAEAMKLYADGLWPSQIAGRLGVPHAVVSGWVR